ncbi:hypothetical protein V1460_09270 [Streptomyces sp. SCSIO 30461]|uniref:hypothetical protein n=1 Tax=Streptomyces sp. SCSIO 30461 TaxID=3118085 RepID=UPI0030CA8A15
MERTATTRRQALMATGAATAAALTGCTSEAGGARPHTAPDGVPAETVLRRRSAARSGALLGHYDTALTAHPELAARLAPLRAAVALHAEALAPTPPAAGPSAAASASPSASSSVSASPRTTGRGAPATAPPGTADADPDTTLRELAAAERNTADVHTAALADAPPEYARLLASVAAAGAVHAYLLTNGDR